MPFLPRPPGCFLFSPSFGGVCPLADPTTGVPNLREIHCPKACPGFFYGVSFRFGFDFGVSLLVLSGFKPRKET